ncbi:MAG: hypothetical protein WCE21_02105 [Candidatus Babeliales bacterium]
MENKLKKWFLGISLVLSCAVHTQQCPYEAVAIVPVADLLGQSMATITPQVTQGYEQLALCPHKGTFSCPRIHQLLFHEQVTVLEESGTEVCIRIPNLFFTTAQTQQPQTTFWTHKKNILPLDALHDARGKIPLPVRYDEKGITNTTIVTLASPFYDTQTGITFSAGTRFVPVKQKFTHEKEWLVYVVDPVHKKIIPIRLPRNHCVALMQKETPAQRQALFVKILKRWTHHKKNGFIPYVWGGCSFLTTCKNSRFRTQATTLLEPTGTAYTYPDCKPPCTGFDCAGLVSRAAQLAGIPYFYKNTRTLAQFLKEIGPNQSAQAGDLIWFPGHVMVISDVQANAIIEARHYSHGYGKVHEIPIGKVFNNINTITDLKRARAHKKKLQRMDSKGMVVQSIPHFKLLRMSSVWS